MDRALGNAMDATDARWAQIEENDIGRSILAAAFKVHSALGPGLLESAYTTCLNLELLGAHHSVRREVTLPMEYAGQIVRNAYRIDLLVDEKVVVEVKAQDGLTPVHRAQLLSYLRLGKFKLGYLLNFNVAHLRTGIARLVNGL
jgi:GxxExxY protein